MGNRPALLTGWGQSFKQWSNSPTWLYKVALPSQSIFGTNGTDFLTSVKGSPVAILALEGADTLNSSNGTDYVYGGLGADVINLSNQTGSANLARGGEGNDTIGYRLVNAQDGTVTIVTQDGETKCSLQGDKGDDSITYSSVDGNVVAGAAFGGGQGADTLTFTGGARFVNSTITGGMNNDLISVTGAESFTNSEINENEGGQLFFHAIFHSVA